jgi:SAM-dependent methyltransferase
VDKQAGCCGSDALTDKIFCVMAEDYAGTEGYVETADLGLGCGLPVQYARIRKGDTVIDLGSGAGNDCFVARHAVGPEGKVIGIDFTPAMIRQARLHAERMGYNNVEFREGDIENLPVHDQVADVIVSNCVLNLVPDKRKVFAEMYRVLKPGGHFSVSDIVLAGELPQALQDDAALYAGCIAGAVLQSTYLRLIRDAGFREVMLQKSNPIEVPMEILARHLSPTEAEAFRQAGNGILSISVYAEKPVRTDSHGNINRPTAGSTADARSTGCSGRS